MSCSNVSYVQNADDIDACVKFTKIALPREISGILVEGVKGFCFRTFP